MSFVDTSREITREFLLTAVVIDDMATMTGPAGHLDEAAVELDGDQLLLEPEEGAVSGSVEGEVPRAGAAAGEDLVDLGFEEESEPFATGTRYGGNKLDAKSIADGFAKIGLFCSVLKPASKAEATDDAVIMLAGRADLVILDWNFFQDDGETTLSLIERLLEPKADKDRFRVIAIYTGEKGLNDISADVKARLDVSFAGFEPTDDTRLSFRRGHTLVGIYAKAGTGVAPIDSDREVPEADLPERLVNDFAFIAQGLLANLAMKSLGVVRKYTHRVLGRFDRRLDAAFLSHRALSDPPADTEEQVVPLIVSELEAAMEDEDVSARVGKEAIIEYVDHTSEGGLRLSTIDADKIRALELVSCAIEFGIESKEVRRDFPDSPAVEWFSVPDLDQKLLAIPKLTSAFAGLHPESSDADEDLVTLMAVRPRYTDRKPVLGPGVIVAEETAPISYWLCVQPACDSVRISGKRNFVFLRLKVPEVGGPFEYVVRGADPAMRIKLRLSKRLYEGQLLPFKATGGKVIAIEEDGGLFFRLSETKKVRFIATLKLEHGMRAVERVTGNLGRVGLTESEYGRRNAREGSGV